MATTDKEVKALWFNLAEALTALEEAGEAPARSFCHWPSGSTGIVGKSGSVRRAPNGDDWLAVME